MFAYFLSKKQTADDFLISSRNRSWFSIAMSKYSTSIWASWFITYTAFIYQFWIGVFWAVIWYVISMFILAYYITPKLYKLSSDKKFLKMWDIVQFKTQSKNLSNMTNILWSAINFWWLLVSVSWWANLITYFGLLNYEFALISMIIVVLWYLFFSWYKWVITTDIIQWGTIILILGILSTFMFQQTNLELLVKTEFDTIDLWTVFWFLIFWAFSVFSYIDRYQLIFSWKNNKSLKKWFLWVVPLIVLSVILLLIMWYLVRLQFPNIDPAIVFVKAIEVYLPAALIPIAIVMFFAAVMSSFDSYVFSISSHLNIFRIKDKIRNIKINSIFISLIATLICYFERDIVNITVIAAWFSLILSLPMMYLFWWKSFTTSNKIPSKFLSSTVFSILWLLIWIAILWLEPSVAIFPLLFWWVWLFFSNRKLDELLTQ